MLKIITFIKLYRTTLKISLKQNPQNSSPHILDNPITVQTSENAWKTNLIQRIHKNKKKKKKKIMSAIPHRSISRINSRNPWNFILYSRIVLATILIVRNLSISNRYIYMSMITFIYLLRERKVDDKITPNTNRSFLINILNNLFDFMYFNNIVIW